jgi:hypothetical protein
LSAWWWDEGEEFGGVMLGRFMLAFFAPRVGQRAMWPAFAAAMILNIYLLCVEWEWAPNIFPFKFHIYWVPVLINGFMIVAALLFSIVLPETASRRRLHPRQPPET